MIPLEPISKRSLDNTGRAERVVALYLNVRIRVRAEGGRGRSAGVIAEALGAEPLSPYFVLSSLRAKRDQTDLNQILGHVLTLGWNQFEEMTIRWLEEARMVLV